MVTENDRHPLTTPVVVHTAKVTGFMAGGWYFAICLSVLIALAIASVFGDWSIPRWLGVGLLFGSHSGALAIGLAVRWVLRKRAVVFDAQGVHWFNGRQVTRQVLWRDVAFVRPRSFFRHATLHMHDGRRVALPDAPPAMRSESRRIKEALTPLTVARVSRVRRLNSWHWCAIGVLATAIGIALAQQGHAIQTRVLDADDPRSLVLPIVALESAGALLAYPGIFLAMMPLFALLGKLERGQQPQFGPSLRDFRNKTDFPEPVTLQKGVAYRYVDPRALRSEAKEGWAATAILGAMALAITALVAFGSSADLGPFNRATGWLLAVLCWCTTAGLVLVSRRRATWAAEAYDVFLWDGEHLWLDRGGERYRLYERPVTSLGHNRPEARGLGSWHEVYTDGNRLFRVDRRHLWPDDGVLPVD